MRRPLELLAVTVASLLTLTASRVDPPALTWALLLGSPAVVVALAVRRRRLEEGAGRVLMGVVVGVAVGQVLTILLTLTPFVHVYDTLPFFFLSFGVPIIVTLCLVTALLDPEPADEPAAPAERDGP